jgi:hypothetical protein
MVYKSMVRRPGERGRNDVASGALNGALAAYGGMACCRESAHRSGEGEKV